MKRRRAFEVAAVGLLLACGLVWWAVAEWQFRDRLGRARREIDLGRYVAARARLVLLSERRPHADEVAYLLGVCEEAGGRADAALAAWARVPEGSPFAGRAAFRRARLLVNRGRLADGEPLLEAAARADGDVAREARRRLAQLYRVEGRTRDLRRLLRETWERAEDPAAVLRDLWRIDAEPVEVGAVGAALERVAGRSPGDDRVCLGRANLAIATGRLDEAAGWLDDCQRRRPDDPAVCEARLGWARAGGRFGEAWRAAGHLRADRFDADEILALRAWFAQTRGPEAERAVLEDLIARDPSQARALERLASLAVEAGRAARAAELRRRKAEVDRSRERYRALLARPPSAADAEELARLAEALGRRFEALAWSALASRRRTGGGAARAGPARRQGPDRRSLADVLADVAPVAVAGPDTSRPRVEPPDFRDDAEAAGLAFHYDNGRSAIRQLPETMGGGVGLLDYDGDGWLDVYCVQGGPFPPASTTTGPHDRLFRNRGDGTFEDVTAPSGLAATARGYGHGVAVGDYDNDGRPDLFVTRWRVYALYRNRGDGTFEDVTSASGLGGDRDWPTSAAWADLDGDGDLDLYVCHYLAWDAEHPPPCGTPAGRASHAYCDPRDFAPRPDHLFRNDRGRFVDVTAEAGVKDRDGRGLGVVAADLDGDGRVDLYVANDTSANFLFHNRGGLRFDEVGLSAGAASNANGGFQAGMGVACGDLDGDGLPDLVVTNFYGEATTYFRNLGGGLFADRTDAIGLGAASRLLLGFGVAFLDANNDGRLDLASANGHVNDYRPVLPYAMPVQLLAVDGTGRLADLAARERPSWQAPRVARGLAAGDLDNDGRVDLLIVSHDAPMSFLRNRTAGGHFVSFRLEGTSSNRDAVGARVMIRSGGRRQVAQRHGGGSYLSSSDPRVHFGLGAADRVDLVEVTWPSGRVDRHADVAGDAFYLLREGAPTRPIPYPSRTPGAP